MFELEARFHDAFDQSAVGMAYTDADGRYVDVNDRMCELLGYSREELLQKSFMELTHAEDLRRELEKLASLQNGDNAHFSMEKRKRRRDGSYLWVNSTISTILDESGNPSKRFVVIQDISEQKEAEAQLQEMNATLEQQVSQRTGELNASLLELEQFAHVVSHDLRAPLRAIAHLSQWIAEDAGDVLPPQSAEHLWKLRTRVRRMETLLEDLLAYYRVGRRHTSATTVNVGDLVDEAIALVEPPAGFTILRDRAMPTIVTYPAPLKTVLGNIIENAVKHHTSENGKVHIGVTATDGWLEFSIQDDGPGIAPEYHERIFELFQTLRPRDEGEGSGLGLAIVRKIVGSMGGQVWLASEPPQGTTFYFTWPNSVPELASV